MQVKQPINQKSVYTSFAIIYTSLMNDVIPVDKAEQACNALNGMNRAYALEIKKTEVEKQANVRNIEMSE